MSYTDVVCVLMFGECDDLAQEWLSYLSHDCYSVVS